MFTRRNMLQVALASGGALLFGDPLSASPRRPEIRVFRKHYALCCDRWMANLKQNGFTVIEESVSDLAAVKVEYGIPKSLIACHTAVVAGYIVEGHVPPALIKQLMVEHPLVRGIAVGGPPTDGKSDDKFASMAVVFTADGTIKPFPIKP